MQAGRVEMHFHHRSKVHDSLINDPVQSPRSVFGPTNGLFHKVCDFFLRCSESFNYLSSLYGKLLEFSGPRDIVLYNVVGARK